MTERYAVAVIGAGPAGLAAGVQAAASGMPSIVLEQAEFANTIHLYDVGKLVFDEPRKIDLHPGLTLRFQRGPREEALRAWREGVENAGADVRCGPGYAVTSIEGQKGNFTVNLKSGESLCVADVVVAIGDQGMLRTFEVEGADLDHVVYRLDDASKYRGKHIVVVGASDAGIENALALMANNNHVSIVNRKDEFPRAKDENRAKIEKAIKEEKIKHYSNTQVIRFEPGRIVLATPDGEAPVEVDLVIGRLGGVRPRPLLESFGITFSSKNNDADPIATESYETNRPGVYLIGAARGEPLIKSCMNEGYEVVEHIRGNHPPKADDKLLNAKFEALPDSMWASTTREVLDRIAAQINILGALTAPQLRSFMRESEIRRTRPGEVIFRRNDFTTSFFSILDGSVEVSSLASDDDGDVSLDPQHRKERALTLCVGNFFGEISMIADRRRSTTVVTGKSCVLIETPRMVMNRLVRSNVEMKKQLDLTSALRWLQNFAPGSSENERKRLAAGAEHKSYRAGEVICEEGEPSKGFHLIRRGAVTITQGDDKRVLNTVRAGGYFGESSLLRGESGKYSARVRAKATTDTILFPKELVLEFLDAHDEIRDKFERKAQTHTINDSMRLAVPHDSEIARFLVDVAGGFEATDLLVIDETLCIGCDNCEVACAETHGGVSRLNRESGPTHASIHIPTTCRHCENPKCMTDCPPDALRRSANGEVFIMDTCIGCGKCEENCPYDVITMTTRDELERPSLLQRMLLRAGASQGEGETQKESVAVKCDLCRNLPEPRHGRPRAACVNACPTGAIVRVNPGPYIQELQRT